jgi:hypothetical protein
MARSPRRGRSSASTCASVCVRVGTLGPSQGGLTEPAIRTVQAAAIVRAWAAVRVRGAVAAGAARAAAAGAPGPAVPSLRRPPRPLCGAFCRVPRRVVQHSVWPDLGPLSVGGALLCHTRGVCLAKYGRGCRWAFASVPAAVLLTAPLTAWAGGWVGALAYQDRRIGAREGQAGVAHVGMAVLASLVADCFVYFAAASVWMTTLFFCIPLYGLDNNLIVYIATLTFTALCSNAIVAVRRPCPHRCGPHVILSTTVKVGTADHDGRVGIGAGGAVAVSLLSAADAARLRLFPALPRHAALCVRSLTRLRCTLR